MLQNQCKHKDDVQSEVQRLRDELADTKSELKRALDQMFDLNDEVGVYV